MEGGDDDLDESSGGEAGSRVGGEIDGAISLDFAGDLAEEILGFFFFIPAGGDGVESWLRRRLRMSRR